LVLIRTKQGVLSIMYICSYDYQNSLGDISETFLAEENSELGTQTFSGQCHKTFWAKIYNTKSQHQSQNIRQYANGIVNYAKKFYEIGH
jgi:hypothetical protein